MAACMFMYRPEVFAIELYDKNDASRPAPPVYYPGSTIAGNVVVNSSQTMKPLHQITVKLCGTAHVKVKSHIRDGKGNKILPVTVTDTETTLELSMELWDVAGNRTTPDGAPRRLAYPMVTISSHSSCSCRLI